MTYVLSEPGLIELEKHCTSRTLFGFDFDGTLAPITGDPAAASASPEIHRFIQEIADKVPTAIVSGRGRFDLTERFPAVNIFKIGNHGIEGVGEFGANATMFQNHVAGWLDQMTQFLVDEHIPDVLIEDKAYSLSVHYRNVKDSGRARELILRSIDRLIPEPRVILGDHVVNLIPQHAPNKGTALLELMRLTGAQKLFYVGDDHTDEDVFSLNEPHLFGVKVRSSDAKSEAPAPTQSKAKYFLQSQDEILRLLQKIVQFLNF